MRVVDFIGVLRRYQDKPSGYTIALFVLVLALGCRELLDPYIKIPYVTLFPAMVVCSLVGGRLAGNLAAVVGGIIAWYLWLPTPGTFALEWPTGQLTILLYVLTSTILLLSTRGLNETLRELEKERDLSAELFRELQHRTAALVGMKLLAGPLNFRLSAVCGLKSDSAPSSDSLAIRSPQLGNIAGSSRPIV
jgi:K+-sensing histidine kinase KdpD